MRRPFKSGFKKGEVPLDTLIGRPLDGRTKPETSLQPVPIQKLPVFPTRMKKSSVKGLTATEKKRMVEQRRKELKEILIKNINSKSPVSLLDHYHQLFPDVNPRAFYYDMKWLKDTGFDREYQTRWTDSVLQDKASEQEKDKPQLYYFGPKGDMYPMEDTSTKPVVNTEPKTAPKKKTPVKPRIKADEKTKIKNKNEGRSKKTNEDPEEEKGSRTEFCSCWFADLLTLF